MTGCVQTISEDLTVPETPAETPKETIPETAEPTANTVISCTNTGSADIRQRGKVTIEYGNGQKESTDDSCVEKDELAFKPFKTHYYCEGVEIKSKLYNCGTNSTCSRGACS